MGFVDCDNFITLLDETYPMYKLKLYSADCEDYIEIMLETDSCDGEATKKTSHFIQALLENGVRFSLEPEEGGAWWKSDWDRYNEYKERKKKQSETVGDEE